MSWIVTTSKATSVRVSAHAHQPSQQETNARLQQEKERRRAEAEADTVLSACAPKRSPVEVSVADFCPQSVCTRRAAAEDELEERCTRRPARSAAPKPARSAPAGQLRQLQALDCQLPTVKWQQASSMAVLSEHAKDAHRVLDDSVSDGATERGNVHNTRLAQVAARYILFSRLAVYIQSSMHRNSVRTSPMHELMQVPAKRPGDPHLHPDVYRPWYTSRTNSYMISGTAMGYGGKAADPLNLSGGAANASPAKQQNFSHLNDTRSTAGKSMGGQSMAMTAKTNRTVSSGKSKLSYTIYADINDADQAAEHLSATKQRKVDMLYEFDEEAQYVLDLIYEDKDKTFGFEVQKKKKKKSALFSKFSEIVNDLLLPPEMRPQWEKEQAALKREKEEEARLKKLKAERDWKRAGGLKDDVEEEQTAAGRLAAMRKALGEGSGHRMEFERAPINGPRTNGRFGTVPQRNVDYFREENFRYEGTQFGGQRDGEGTQWYNDGYRYEGDWSFNMRQGFGSLDYPDGSLYEGQFFENKQHGFGVFKGIDGKTYRGSWECGKKHGFGEMPDKKKGLIFSGQWVAGKRHGFGIQLDLKTADVFAGQWEYGLKHGVGIMRQKHPSLGDVRIRMEWNRGKLMKEESYDALVHGTQEGEAATWASHYAKDSAMNADLAVQQRVVYPEHPVRPKRELDYQVQQAEEAHAAAIDADGVQVIVEEKVLDDRLKIPAVEFRRLISLAHSADKYVEEMVLPILDDAQSVAKTESEAEHFLVGPIWDQNLLRLSHHFATKIQRLWRKKGLNRLVRVAREEAMDGIETDEMRGKRFVREINEKRLIDEQAIVKQMELENHDLRRLQNDCQQLAAEENYKTPIEFLLRTRQLVRADHVKCPSSETRSSILLGDRLAARLKKLRDKGSLWKASKPQMQSMMSMLGMLKKAEQRERTPDDADKTKERIEADQNEAVLLEGLAENLDLDMGTIKYKDGSRYLGETYCGLPHGFGTTMNPDGSSYCGQHLNGHRHGLGVYAAQLGEPEEELQRIYSGEWFRGDRHGFAIERVLFKKRILKSCVICEYEREVKCHIEAANPEDHEEWLLAFDSVTAQGRGAKIEAEKLAMAEGNVAEITASMSIDFDWQRGMANYTGTFNQVGQKHGLGIQTWHDGLEYAGEFVCGLAHGAGRESYPDRSTYIGNFEQGRRHGWGKYLSDNGITYIGQFKEGSRHGHGVEHEQRRSDGTMLWMAFVKYDQDHLILMESLNPVKAKAWLDNAETSIRTAARRATAASPCSKIEYEDNNKEDALFYVGGVLDNQRTGVGVLTHKNGTQYIGEWLADKKHGLGVENYGDEVSYYKGQFNYGVRHGWGEYFDGKSERLYRGHWANGQRHGRGWERAVLNMISGKIFKEFLIEYDLDKEVGRRFITAASKLEFLTEVSAMVKRADDMKDLTISMYEDMLD